MNVLQLADGHVIQDGAECARRNDVCLHTVDRISRDNGRTE